MDARKARYSYLFAVVALLIAGLIGVQLFWIGKTISVEEQSLRRSLTGDFEKLATEVETQSYCYKLFGKTYIHKGEGIYMIKQQVDSNGNYIPATRGGQVDTVDMFNFHLVEGDTFIESYNSLELTHFAASLDVSFNFWIEGVKDPRKYEFGKLTNQNINVAFDNSLNIDTILDKEYLDTEIKKILRKHGLDSDYALGISKGRSADYVFLMGDSRPGEKYKDLVSVPLFANRIAEPYFFTVGFAGPYMKIIRSMSVMMISSALVILFLVASFIYFVRVIINQRRLSEMKNAFINNITHEFRTPITNIHLAVQNWRDTQRSAGFYYDIIEEENKNLEAKVDQVLQLASLTHNGRSGDHQPVDMLQITQKAIDSFRMQVQHVNGAISCDVSAVSTIVQGDETELLNMMKNLLDNAIKYKDTRPPRIAVRIWENDKSLVVEVEDNGIGMSAQTQQHIFDRFYRSYTGDRHDVKGFGLGLSYVKHIVDHHYGQIRVKSRLGKGTTFTIFLPKTNTKI